MTQSTKQLAPKQLAPKLLAPPRHLERGAVSLLRSDGRWCTLTGISRCLETILNRCDGTTPTDDLIASAATDDRVQIRGLVDQLVRQELATYVATSAPLVIAVDGSGPLADELRRRLPWAYPWRDRRPDVVVLASDSITPDRGLVAELTGARIAYLVVCAHADHAQVGPLVMPGRGPGLCCHDRWLLHQAMDLNQLMALSRAEASPDPWALNWAVGETVCALTQLVTRGTSRLVGAALTRSSIDWATRTLRWDPHPECCGSVERAVPAGLAS